MKNYISLSILCMLISFSCTQQQPIQNTSQVEAVNQTPGIFNETKIIDEIGKYSSRYGADIISELYAEALEKDEALNKLDAKVLGVNVLLQDSIASYEEYERINAQYWASVQNLVQQLKDSTTRKATEHAFAKLEMEFKNSVANYDSTKNRIEVHENTLSDQYLLMKLMVTMPMMMNFQRNEKPSIAPMNNAAKQYQQLIEETKPYTIIK